MVDRSELQNKITEKDIREVYPYKFEIVEGDVMDRAIIEKDPKYAYVKIVDIPGGKGNVSAHTVMGAGDGEIYCYLTPKVAVTIKDYSIIKYNERIKTKHFGKYAENIE